MESWSYVDVVWERRKPTRQSKSRGDQVLFEVLLWVHLLGHVRGVHTKSIKKQIYTVTNPTCFLRSRGSWVELSWVCILFLSQFCLFLYLMFKLLVLVLIRSYVSWRIRTRFCPHPYGVLWCLSLTFFYINKKYQQLTNSFFVKCFWMGLTTHIPTVALTSFVLGFFISQLSFLFI